MNKRIKQLAEQATSIVESPPNREGWTSSYAYFDREKFAQLIVQDCIDILAGYRGKIIWKNEDEMHQNPIYVIQKHFGVKE